MPQEKEYYSLYKPQKCCTLGVTVNSIMPARWRFIQWVVFLFLGHQLSLQLAYQWNAIKPPRVTKILHFIFLLKTKESASLAWLFLHMHWIGVLLDLWKSDFFIGDPNYYVIRSTDVYGRYSQLHVRWKSVLRTEVFYHYFSMQPRNMQCTQFFNGHAIDCIVFPEIWACAVSVYQALGPLLCMRD